MRPALIIIDMLNDFISGTLKTEEAISTVKPTKKAIDVFRRRKYPIFYVNDSHYNNDFEIPLWGPHAMKGTDGAKVYEEIKPEKDDFVLEKHAYSAFFQTPLDYLLRTNGIDTVFLAGLDADICVRHTAADAFFRGYKIYVIKDAVAARIDKNWEIYYKKVYNANIVYSEELEKII
ncbi:nicotinamidase-like amidase [Caldisphaera lagunensis DSM 15908]|uniref:Nicotinamidase-like amidase n=1 Tax=Caldisphaera lagunensis (strain DSM 15908 / JCM 11604 / ANMR 0165 / IC-154) TaxID=1056495 RepID=L0ADN5_CALLD|nr:isochorismatase family cysteine hydrolase [Caldisphaera lagunensis]AFZ71247.1 nicotinamidase-like amidase [Caldisphaera lagunensis DSM 15908]